MLNSKKLKVNNAILTCLILILGWINIYSQCAYDYLCKAYSAPRNLKIVLCDSALMVDSTYIPAYVYKFKTIWFPSTHGSPKPRDTADSAYKVERKRTMEEAKAVTDKAWLIDSQYIKIYEFKYIIDGWDKIDATLYQKLNGEMKYKKELIYNNINLKCRPNDAMLYLERAQLFSDLGLYDSALICADKVNFSWQDTVLNLKRSIFAKTNNKPGIKHIENDLTSLKWQEQNNWVNKVENEILKSTEDCCIRMYCQALKDDCKQNRIQFNDLKNRCKKIFIKYRYLKPFDNQKCNKEEGKCINIWD
jgi:hypothetical protein